MDHAVTVKGVVLAHGGVDLVVAVTQVHAVQVSGQLANHLQIRRAGRPLGVGGAVAAVEVGVVRGQTAQFDARMNFKHRIFQLSREEGWVATRSAQALKHGGGGHPKGAGQCGHTVAQLARLHFVKQTTHQHGASGAHRVAQGD